MNMKHNILLDVTIKANEIQNQYFFQMDSPPLLKGIQNMVAKFNESIQCPPEVTYILQMLNNKYGLDSIRYVCLKVLGCHHALDTSSAHVEGFGMTRGGFFFPCFEKYDDSRTSAVHDQLEKKQHFESKFSNSNLSG